VEGQAEILHQSICEADELGEGKSFEGAVLFGDEFEGDFSQLLAVREEDASVVGGVLADERLELGVRDFLDGVGGGEVGQFVDEQIDPMITIQL
jgi:hypothetical protein